MIGSLAIRRRQTSWPACGWPALALIVGWLAGCGRPTAVVDPAAARPPASVPQAVRDTLLDGAITVLGHLDDYDEATAFAQVFDRLNQWSHAEGQALRAMQWTADPLVNTLDERLRPAAVIRGLEATDFDAGGDLVALRDQRWLADVARVARGDAVDDLAIAENLFRWIVRSLAIVTDPPMVPSETTPGSRWFSAGEILLAGRGSAAQRAWLFLELLRQAGLDGVMLATGGDSAASARPWIPALISGGEAYLFEPTYGMAVPGPNGTGVATARQAAADPTILSRLSFPDRPYPVQAADLRAPWILVAADPVALSKRMRRLESQLAGSSTMSLSVEPSALASRAVEAIPGAVTDRCGLWSFPWETASRRPLATTQKALAAELAVMAIAMERRSAEDSLRRGRVMRPLYAARVREFRGDVDGPDGAKAAYLAARPTAATMRAATAGLPAAEAEARQRLYEQMKEDATYWLGILTLAEGDDEAAVDYLERMMLGAAPDSRWTDAARVNLAQALLGLGRTADAVAALRSDASPQRFGSRILAARLAETPR